MAATTPGSDAWGHVACKTRDNSDEGFQSVRSPRFAGFQDSGLPRLSLFSPVCLCGILHNGTEEHLAVFTV